MYTETTRRCVAVAGGWALRRALVAARAGAAHAGSRHGAATTYMHMHMHMCM